MFRENRGMFYLVERFDGLLGEIAEKTAGTQIAIQRAFKAVQSGHTHWRYLHLPQKHVCAGFWRETIDQQQSFKSRISSDCPLRK
jgi:hypothetical protein